MTERKRTEERVRSALLELEAPDEPMAEERARQVVEAAFDGHVPSPSPLPRAPASRDRCPRGRRHRWVRADAGGRGRPRVDRRNDRAGRGGRGATAHLAANARKRAGRSADRCLDHPRGRLQAPPWRLRPGDMVAERPVRRRRRRLGAPGDRSRRELPLVDRGRRAGEGDRLVVRRGLPGRLPRGRRDASRHGRRSHGPRDRAGSGRAAGVAARVRSGEPRFTA